MVCSLVIAQVNVDSDGKVAIGIDAAPLSTLSVNGSGESESEVTIQSVKSMTLTTRHLPTGDLTGWARACNSSVALSPHTFNAGIFGYAYTSSAINTGRSFGVFGIAGNYKFGYNYGVLGTLYGTNNGTGIYGTSVHNDHGVSINGRALLSWREVAWMLACICIL